MLARSVNGVPTENRGVIFGCRRCVLVSVVVVVAVVAVVVQIGYCFLFVVVVVCLFVCLFVQRQSCTMAEFLSAMTQAIQKELGDRRSLETHR